MGLWGGGGCQNPPPGDAELLSKTLGGGGAVVVDTLGTGKLAGTKHCIDIIACCNGNELKCAVVYACAHPAAPECR